MSNPRLARDQALGGKPERRNLTVLFCDIVGSSALATRLDPEDLRDILHAFQRCCGEATRRYDGHVARYMGDGVLVYFGYPEAHEDDAERAVNAALAMVETISALSFPHAGPIRVRIGIATGLVIVGDLIGEGHSREFALIGEAPNLAAALQQSAQPNQILISPQTRRLLGKLFEFADLGEQTVKGHAHGVRVWSVTGRSAVPTRFEARQSSAALPLFGRDSELARLFDHFDAAQAGREQVVLVSGEPGIGKSRLVRALSDRLAETDAGACTLWLQCSSYHTSSPWYPVVRYLEGAADIRSEDAADTKLDKLAAWIAGTLPEETASATPLLAALLSIPTGERYERLALTPQQQKRRTVAALIDLVRAQAAQRPLVIAWEDVHWIDPTSLEFLEQLRDQAKDLPVLIVLTFRPGLGPAWPAQPHLGALTIERLEPADVSQLVQVLAGERVLPPSVVAEIIAKTDGVPLFVEEVTRAVLEGQRPGRAAGAASVVTVPDTLHETLMGRLDRQASVKTVAQVASAIGREFPLDLLEAVAPLAKADVRAGIDRLLATGLLNHGSGDGACLFKHALLQDAVYASMLRDERRRLHGAIARALCAQFAEVAESEPELVAHHYTQAGEAKAAIRYWLKGGEQAGRRSAFVEAMSDFKTALRLLSELPAGAERDALELQIQQSLAMTSIALKGFGADETMQTFVRALELCEKFDNFAHVSAVLNGLFGFHLMRGEFEQARGRAVELLERAGKLDDSTGLLMGHRALGMSQFVIGELAQAQNHLRSALKLYDPVRHAPLALAFSHDLEASAQAYLGPTCVLLGDIEEGLFNARDALARAERMRHPHTICYVLIFLAGSYLIAGLPAQARPVTERIIAMANEFDFEQWRAGGVMLRGWALLDLGEIEGGLADVRASIDLLEATGTLIWMQFAHFLLARGLTETGQRDAAVEIVERLIEEIKATSGRWFEAELHHFKGRLRHARGDEIEAIEVCYETALAIAARQGARLWELRAMNSLCALWDAQGRKEEASARLAPLFARFNGGGLNPDLQTAMSRMAIPPGQ